MKSETVMLGSLFAACLLVCTLVLGQMLVAAPLSARFAAGSHATPTLIASPCPAQDDGSRCTPTRS